MKCGYFLRSTSIGIFYNSGDKLMSGSIYTVKHLLIEIVLSFLGEVEK